jgi:cation diffusion facilitator CzcD-associated flavoprotein CzcO
MAYLRETVAENDLGPKIRFGHRVARAEWSSADARWTVTATASDGEVTITAGFLFMGAGYYRYSAGYDAKLPNTERFAGTIVHPQFWPEHLDVDGKRVLVIGSGATAMTLVPALADQGAQVTMLQRSPTYVVARPDVDRLANRLRKLLPDKAAYAITRKKNVTLQQWIYKRSRTQPAKMKAGLLKMTRKHLGPDFDVDRHFTPSYNPWDQRLCLVPNADLFEAINSGKATVVTDTIDTFTAGGIRLASGEELAADIVVTATGLQLVTLGEAEVVVDGEPVDFSQTFTYKGFMYSGVPNLASAFGYINASWTLRADLIGRYVCRLLDHMRQTATTICTPTLRADDAGMTVRPWIEGFSSGYIQRDIDKLPKQGDREPWVNPQNYTRDRKLFLKDPVDDGVMRFTTAKVRAAVA